MRRRSTGRKSIAGFLNIGLPPLVPVPYIHMFHGDGELPTEEELLDAALRSVRRTIHDDELCETVRFLLENPGIIVMTIIPMEDDFLPDLETLRELGLDEYTERILERCDTVVVAAAHVPPVASGTGILLLEVIRRAWSRHLGGLEFDPSSMRITAVDPDPQPLEDIPPICDYVSVLTSIGSKGLTWSTTSGLALTGLPELEIRDAPADASEASMVLLTAAAETILNLMLDQLNDDMPESPAVLLPIELRISTEDLMAAYGREAEPPEGARGWTIVRLRLHRPKHRSESAMIELVPPLKYSGPPTSWVYSAYADLVGSQTSELSHIPDDDEEMEEAHKQALSELLSVRERFRAGLPLGHLLYVKYPLKTLAGGNEYVWCVVSQWKGQSLTTQLASVPVDRPDVRTGSTITFLEADIYDWAIFGPGNYAEGNYTGEVLMRRGEQSHPEEDG